MGMSIVLAALACKFCHYKSYEEKYRLGIIRLNSTVFSKTFHCALERSMAA